MVIPLGIMTLTSEFAMEEPAFPSDAGGSWSPALISWAFFRDLNVRDMSHSF